MTEQKEIVNKVAQSGIITLDLEQLIPDRPHVELDIREQLFQGLILREKDFRQFIKDHDWSQYADRRLAVHCSSDAIIPTWAYMLVVKACAPYTSEVYLCAPEALNALVAERHIAKVDAGQYRDARVVIKGCGNREISDHAYVALSVVLMPYVKSLMFGEPCSTVPVYKRP